MDFKKIVGLINDFNVLNGICKEWMCVYGLFENIFYLDIEKIWWELVFVNDFY